MPSASLMQDCNMVGTEKLARTPVESLPSLLMLQQTESRLEQRLHHLHLRCSPIRQMELHQQQKLYPRLLQTWATCVWMSSCSDVCHYHTMIADEFVYGWNGGAELVDQSIRDCSKHFLHLGMYTLWANHITLLTLQSEQLVMIIAFLQIVANFGVDKKVNILLFIKCL